MDLSVIVPSFNKGHHLVNHLASLGSQTFPHDRFEVIIVDDGSTDHTLPVVREARKVFDYDIRYFYLDRPGYTPAPLAWNFGIRQARSDIIVQMGPDTIAAKDALELHYAYQTMGADHLYVFGVCYNISTPMAQNLIKTVSATRLMGAECIISGIRPEIAQTVVHLGIDLSNIITKSTLASALKYAYTILQLEVRRKETTQQLAPN